MGLHDSMVIMQDNEVSGGNVLSQAAPEQEFSSAALQGGAGKVAGPAMPVQAEKPAILDESSKFQADGPAINAAAPSSLVSDIAILHVTEPFFLNAFLKACSL